MQLNKGLLSMYLCQALLQLLEIGQWMKETNIPALMEKNNANVIETVNNRLSLLESYVKLKKIYVYTHTHKSKG